MSVPNWRRNAQLFTAVSTTSTVVGTFQYLDDADNCVVSFGTYVDDDGSGLVQSLVTVKSSTRYTPHQGEPVVLTWTNGHLKLTGPARAKASNGTIVSISPPHATVRVGSRNYVMPYAVSVADDIAVGDPVAIDWDTAGGYVKDKLSTTPTTDPDAPPKLSTDQKPFTLNFFAKQSGSYKNSKWWTQDVRADDDDVNGGWFYGNVIRKSLRNDAYISSVEIYLPARSLKGALPKIGRHTQDTRPAGSLSVSDSATRGHRSGWVHLPVAWAEGWRDSAGGVAVNNGGTNIYKGIQADRQSGKLRIRGRQ